MTPALRTARWLTAAALALAASAIYLGYTVSLWAIPGCLYGAALLAWCSRREYAIHRQILTDHENARRAALELEALGPCCRLAEHSGGRAHGADCPQPPDLDTVLAGACCDMWLVSRGDTHGPKCPTNSTRSSAA